ncbi:MAG: S49 family peptidase, partial [Planctomycetota bacterium]
MQRAGVGAAIACGLGAALPSGVLADEASVAVIEISGTPLERSTGPAWFDSGEPTLLELVETLDTVAMDDEFAGVMLRLKGAALGATHVEELSRAIERVRAEGKRVDVFGEFYGASDLMLGAHADSVLMQAGGIVSLPGMHMEEMFLADALEWLGVKAQMIQVGDYKGANEMMTRSEPSPAWDENINGLLDGMYHNQRKMFKDGRDLSDRELDQAMSELWMADGETAVNVGMIDAEVDLEHLTLVVVHAV